MNAISTMHVLKVRVMGLAPLSTIFQKYRDDQFYWSGEQEYLRYHQRQIRKETACHILWFLVGRGRRQKKSFNDHLKIKSYKPGGGILVSRIRITDFSKIHVPFMARCTQYSTM
jgi:hypothetical protein